MDTVIVIALAMVFVHEMAKFKTTASQRKQRKLQKGRKRRLKLKSKPVLAATNSGEKVQVVAPQVNVDTYRSTSCCSRDSDCDGVGSQGDPPVTPNAEAYHCSSSAPPTQGDSVLSIFDERFFRASLNKQDDDMVHRIKTYPMKEQCEELEDLFRERTDSMHYYIEKVDEQRREMDEMVNEYKGKIKRVRSFWKDKIYKGGSRAGKILKHALTY